MDDKLKNSETAGQDEARVQQEQAQDVPEGAVEIPVEIVRDEAPEEAAGMEAPKAEAEKPLDEDAVELGEPLADEAQAEAAPSVADLQAEIARLQAALEEQTRASQEEIRDLRMRNQAELENFKKRLTREHGEHLKYAAEKVMKDLIPSLDNLELAIVYGSKEEACKNMLQGIEMTQKLLLDAVGRHGLVRVGKEGEVFDPALHEALGCESRSDLAADTIARVMQSGYSLEGRLLRPAKVMVNKI